MEGQGKNMKSAARTMQETMDELTSTTCLPACSLAVGLGRGREGREGEEKEGSKETHEIADLGGDLSPRVGPNWASKNADTGGDFVQKN